MKKILNIKTQRGIKLFGILLFVIGICFGFRISDFGFLKQVLAQARIPLVVAPARQQVNINPGESETIMVRFFNEGAAPISGSLRVVDFIVQDNQGSPILLEDGEELSNRFSAASWASLPYERAAIPAGDVLRFQFTLNVPEDARPGGRYLAVVFEQTGANITGTSGDLQEGESAVAPRIVGLVYIRVAGPIEENAFVKRLITPSFIEYGPVPVTAEILNRGDYHITPQGQLTLYNWFGKPAGTVVLEDKNIFPDASRIYEEELGGRIMIGKYRVDLAASYGETGKVLAGSVFFWAFPVKLVLIVILTIIIIILLVTLIWKNIKKGQVKLEKKLEEEISQIEELKNKYKDVVSSPSTAPKK